MMEIRQASDFPEAQRAAEGSRSARLNERVGNYMRAAEGLFYVDDPANDVQIEGPVEEVEDGAWVTCRVFVRLDDDEVDEDRPELSYDGHGINGPDEYRSRVATFTSPEAGERYGRLFEAAPKLAAALRATGQAEAPCDNPKECGTDWGTCVPCIARDALDGIAP